MCSYNPQEAISFLTRLMAVESVNGTSGEMDIARAIADWYGDGANLMKIDSYRANVVIRLMGKNPGDATLFNGHLDTVPFGNRESWDTSPNCPTTIGGSLYGRGSSDMKGGLAACLFALKHLAKTGFVPKHDILYIATCDEESGVLGAQRAAESGFLEDVERIIIGEPTGNGISIASKGTLWLHLTASGKTAHGAYPDNGVNAIALITSLYESLQEELSLHSHPYLGKPTCALTKISGGIKENMIPDQCTAALDIRTIPQFGNDNVLNCVQKAVAAIEERNPGCKVSVEIANNRIPVEIPPEHPLVGLVSEAVKEVTGAEPPCIGTFFFSDASVFLLHKQVPVVLFGPGDSEMAHQNNEYILLEDYIKSVECYTALMRKL